LNCFIGVFAFKSAVVYCIDTLGVHLMRWVLHKGVGALLVGFKKGSWVICL